MFGTKYAIWALPPIHLAVFFLVNKEQHNKYVLWKCGFDPSFMQYCVFRTSTICHTHSLHVPSYMCAQKSSRFQCTNISFAHQNRVHSNIVPSMICAIVYVCENNSTFASDENLRTIENCDNNNCTFSAYGSTYANVYGEQECIWIFKLR